jgi:hypothetical protein
MINRLLYGIFHINPRRPYGMLAQVPPRRKKNVFFRNSRFPVRSVFVINVSLLTSVVRYWLRRKHGKSLLCNTWCIWHVSPSAAETPILAQEPNARGLIWVEGWYGMWYEKCHIITYLSYFHASFFIFVRRPLLITKKTWKKLVMQHMMSLLIEDLVLYEKCNCIRIMSL